MKQNSKFLALAIILIAFTVNTFAQVTETATASATIVSPITINTTADLNFGNVAASATAGTVILAPGGGRTPSVGVTLPATAGTVSAAAFDVTGTAGYTFSITIPGGAYTTTIASGANTMTVTNYTSSAASGTIDNATFPTFTVGARLNVGINQAGGSYSSENAGGTGPFSVTVNYN